MGASAAEGSGGGANNFTFTITAATASGVNITVNYSTGDGSASFTESDYAQTTGSVTIPAGSTTTTFNVPVNRDSMFEIDETFNTNLTAGSGFTVAGSILTTVATITNDDTMPTVQFATSAGTLIESGGVFSATLTLSPVSGLSTTVNFTRSGTASTADSSDYALTSSPIIIPAGATSGTIIFTLTNDALFEISETADISITTLSNGTLGAANLFSLTVIDDDSLVVEANYPTNGSKWNDYVKFDNSPYGNRPWNQDDEACLGSENGRYGHLGGCVHGGELRKVTVYGISSCMNLQITDNLNAFDWVCEPILGNATFFSIGLKEPKGLKDLITGSGGAGSWINNFVTVTTISGGTFVGQSQPSAWWTNIISEAPNDDQSSTLVSTLSTESTVYYAHTSRRYYSLDITADKIALVTTGTAYISMNGYGSGAGPCNATSATSSSGTLSALICIDNIKFLWLESKLTGTGLNGSLFSVTWAANLGLLGYGINYSRINKTIINSFQAANGHPSFKLMNSRSNLISDLESYKTGSGVYLTSSSLNEFIDLKVSNTLGNGTNGYLLQLDSLSKSNYFYDTRLANATHTTSTANSGIILYGSNNIFQRTMITNINGHSSYSSGVTLSSGTNNILVGLGAFATQNTGINFVGASKNTILHFTSANNVYNGIYFSGTNSDNFIGSTAIANTNKGIETISSVSGTGNIFRNIASTNNSNYGFDMYNTNFGAAPGYIIVGYNGTLDCSGNSFNMCTSTGTLISNRDLRTAFVGDLGVDDSKNLFDDSAGSAGNTSSFNIGSWTQFDFWLRGWGKSGTILDPVTQGYPSASLKIWDWRVKLLSALQDISMYGNTSNESFISASPCPLAVDGDEATQINLRTFLHNAIEIDHDFIGNDNGLCESNESCIYAPNVGAYQGEGDINSTGTCAFQNGTVSNVEMHAYPVRGI
jgi:hypothetical protein